MIWPAWQLEMGRHVEARAIAATMGRDVRATRLRPRLTQEPLACASAQPPAAGSDRTRIGWAWTTRYGARCVPRSNRTAATRRRSALEHGTFREGPTGTRPERHAGRNVSSQASGTSLTLRNVSRTGQRQHTLATIRPARTCRPTRGCADRASIGAWLRRQSWTVTIGRSDPRSLVGRPAAVRLDARRLTNSRSTY